MAITGLIMAMPAIFAFYCAWVVAMLLRPFFVFVLACLLWNAPFTLLKLRMVADTFLYMFLCKDKKYKKPSDRGAFLSSLPSSSKKTIVFVRHGESCWNDTFNAGERKKLDFIKGFIPGLIKSLYYEAYLALAGKVDSWFYDSPLSYYGISQIDALARYLSKSAASSAEQEVFDLLNGAPSCPKTSVLVSSNLRRALSTVCIGFRSRLASNPSEKIVVHPSLQEISRNPDTLSITPPGHQVNASWIEKDALPQIQPILTDRVDMNHHVGNKALSSNGGLRMSSFCTFAFSRPEDCLICGGHSLWFRSFFQAYLPEGSTHTGKKKKIVNGGTVMFDLYKVQNGGGWEYVVDEKSIKVVYGGF
ncbi:hypothetical protein TrRE_jg3086 [Triparma retinervis]|uniref:Uncharacterized protein n=1 Tax=Triparma retinervis TaxID=2557542 RepID=A0A9W7DTL4_9STRA|nr:hypothetical protein TrRE_jg3086 [Triparma retinervis]